MSVFSRISSINTWLSDLSRNSNKSRFALMNDLLQLRRTKAVSRNEYANFRLYDRDEAFRNTFLPYADAEKYWEILNPRVHACLARDKFLAHCLLEAVGIPVPRLIAYYDPESASSTDLIGHSYENISDILRKKSVSTFVVKPSRDSAHGNGVVVCRELIDKNGKLVMRKLDGTEVPVRQILQSEPLLFEETVCQTKQISSLNESSLNTVRIMTALYPDSSVRIIAAFIKIGRHGSDVDNAGDGGNVDCGVDIETGELFNPLQFNSWRDIRKIDSHPDSNTRLTGFAIANWPLIVERVKYFQGLLPQLKVIGWDVAITDNGPVIIEINNWWDTTGQEFIGRGWAPEVKHCYDVWLKDGKRH